MKEEYELNQEQVKQIHQLSIQFIGEVQALITEEIFKEWLVTLKPSHRQLCEMEGYAAAKHTPPFLDFVMAKNNFTLEQYMKDRLTQDVYEHWVRFAAKYKIKM